MTSAVPTDNAVATPSVTGGYNFASETYNDCFRDLPTPNTEALREAEINYLDTFDKQKWYDDPVSF